MPIPPIADTARHAPVAPSVKLRTTGLAKQYGSTTALHPLDLDVYSGELLTLLGPSGSGKTTLLQLICGLVPPSTGKLLIDSIDRTHAPAHLRDIGVVFQSYALFPHLSVFENIAFPLEMRRIDAATRRRNVMEALELVGLTTLSQRFPRELSGGQQQRVALARSLVYRPSLLLMDESLSALDRKLRESMQVEIKRIHRETGATIIFVTHDQDEALALSDRVCLMNNGRIEQIGTPEDIYNHPRNKFVADFIGISNKVDGRISIDGHLDTADGQVPLYRDNHSHAVGTSVSIILRPEHLRTSRVDGYLSGRVCERIYGGSETRLMVRLSSGNIMTVRHADTQNVPELDAPIFLNWDVRTACVLDR